MAKLYLSNSSDLDLPLILNLIIIKEHVYFFRTQWKCLLYISEMYLLDKITEILFEEFSHWKWWMLVEIEELVSLENAEYDRTSYLRTF